jgi:hypothetical protein
MILLIQLILLACLFYIGTVCIRDPMKIVNILALYAQLIFGKLLPHLDSKSELKEALTLIRTDPSGYEKRFGFQFAMVRLTGYVALFVSVTGACILMLAKK